LNNLEKDLLVNN